MTGARAKAPTLAWLLTVLTCLLAGMAIVESRHQTVALPHPDGTRSPAGVVKPVAAADAPTPIPTPPPLPTPLFADVPVPPSTGPATLRVVRLSVPPGVGLPFELAPGPTVLIVEAGAISVRVDGAVWFGQVLDAAQTDTVLRSGERLVVAPAMRYAVRNDGSTPAEVLVVAIVPVAIPTPSLSPAKSLHASPTPWPDSVGNPP